jgi:fatty-acyl-CoA synthase
VATLGWNHARHLEAYFGVPLAGAVLHTMNPRLHPADLTYIMNHADDQVLLIDDVLLPVW